MGIIANLAASARQALARVLPRAQHAPFQLRGHYRRTQVQPARDSGHRPCRCRTSFRLLTTGSSPQRLGGRSTQCRARSCSFENGNLYAAHGLMLAMTREATGPRAHGAAHEPVCAPLGDSLTVHPSAGARCTAATLAEAITPQDMAAAGSYTVMLGLAPSTQVWFERPNRRARRIGNSALRF